MVQTPGPRDLNAMKTKEEAIHQQITKFHRVNAYQGQLCYCVLCIIYNYCETTTTTTQHTDVKL